MTTFTRLTVVGSARRAELVVPDDTSIEGLLPRLLELLDEPSGPVSRPLALVRPTGEQVDASRSAAEQALGDGELLRLVRADDVPPPPEVADVTDVVGESWAVRPGLWSDRAREATAAVAIGTLSCVALLVAEGSRPVLALGVLAVLAAAAAVVGRLPPPRPTELRPSAGTGGRWAAVACTAAAAGAAWPAAAAVPLPGGLPVPLDRLVPVAALVWAVLALGVGVGLRSRAALAGSLAGLGLVLLPLALAAAGIEPGHVVAVVAVAATVVLGLLPWYALTSAGLTGLDDQVLSGRPGRRDVVLRTADTAYASLSWAVFGVALALAGSAVALVLEPGPWPLALGLVVALVAALRTRAFPLAVQQLPLWFAALAVVAVALVHLRPGGDRLTTLGLVVLAAAAAVAAGARPPAHVRASFRRAGNLLELVAVLAVVPLVLGVFGVYADLLRAFR